MTSILGVMNPSSLKLDPDPPHTGIVATHLFYLKGIPTVDDETTITCPQCGTENTPGSDECTNCGMSLTPPEEGVEPSAGQTTDGPLEREDG
jgi:predicted RNA-binding Zn-ribbon protein involved in translation (DUF1610 family)